MVASSRNQTYPSLALKRALTVHLGTFILRIHIHMYNSNLSPSIDPSIRVTYHPRSKKVSQSGLYAKTTHLVFSQRITISNTKTFPIENLKIIDQTPVSEDSDITVKLVSPALKLPGEVGISPLKVALGVIAQWHGADEVEGEVEALGRDGKLDWVCAVPAQEKIGLVLQWEVTAPVKTAIAGLT
jgi:Domain of unknown function (DUF4139)